MTNPVADVAGARTDGATALAAARDPAAEEYTVYPRLVRDADRRTTWLTVDDAAVCDLDDWR